MKKKRKELTHTKRNFFSANALRKCVLILMNIKGETYWNENNVSCVCGDGGGGSDIAHTNSENCK